MDKYIGNKKSILEDIEEFMVKKDIEQKVFFDAFTGTTNVAQYFKQRGFSTISNDINDFSYVLQKAYLENNDFPQFEKLLKFSELSEYNFSDKNLDLLLGTSLRKIITDKIFVLDYDKKTDYKKNIVPLLKVISYLNDLRIPKNITERESFFYDYYCVNGRLSSYRSSRGTNGNRNYFSEYNALKVGVLLEKIRKWHFEDELICQMEFFILLTSIIEEVTLVANVNGTFHDFNRKKLFPNALVDMRLKAPVLNISHNDAKYCIFQGNSNELKDRNDFKIINNRIEVLYIDPPYNFRQYSSYYHMLNFIAKYHMIEDVIEYGQELEFVRGQNMKDDIKSEYCYRESFAYALSDLIKGINCSHILISYYDENNHWNHGKKINSNEGRNVILDIFKNSADIVGFDEEPFLIERHNYQSQNGHKKKKIDELLFYAKKR